MIQHRKPHKTQTHGKLCKTWDPRPGPAAGLPRVPRQVPTHPHVPHCAHSLLVTSLWLLRCWGHWAFILLKYDQYCYTFKVHKLVYNKNLQKDDENQN